jgi:GGDEF domain-containing protein
VGSSATTNLLTSLPNAGSLFLLLDAELSRRPDFDGIGGDLDGFKQINERFGHLEGNKVLCALGNGLKSICREYHSVARMGGADNKASALQEIIAQTCHQIVWRDFAHSQRRCGQLSRRHIGCGGPLGRSRPAHVHAEADRKLVARQPDATRCGNVLGRPLVSEPIF